MQFKKIIGSFFFIIAAQNMHAQTPADAIVSSYVDAVGGRDKWNQINSLVIEGTIEVMGNSSTDKITILNGKGYKSEMNFGGSDIVQAVTDTGGWMINSFTGAPEPTAMERGQYLSLKDNIFVAGPLFNYQNNGYLVRLAGQDSVDGKPVYKIEATSPDSILTTYFIDSASHYLRQKIVSVNGLITTIKYSDFQKTDFGNIMPYTEELSIPQGYQLVFKVNKITVNAPVDVSIFSMPKKQQ